MRLSAHDSGSGWLARPCLYDSFIRDSTPVYPGALRSLLDEALDSLSKTHPRKVRVVELRYFGGLSIQETAAVLQVAPETVMRDWKMAKTWLFREFSQMRPPAV